MVRAEEIARKSFSRRLHRYVPENDDARRRHKCTLDVVFRPRPPFGLLAAKAFASLRGLLRGPTEDITTTIMTYRFLIEKVLTYVDNSARQCVYAYAYAYMSVCICI